LNESKETNMKTTSKAYGAKIVNKGMGGFLCPPGHPSHTQSVETGRSDNPNGCYSLEAAIKSEWLSAGLRGRCSGILKRWEASKLPLESEPVQAWIREVLGYFKGCYAGQDKDGNPSWNAGELRIDSTADPMLNIDAHAGVHLIREYYLDFTPTAEQFASAQWGKPAN
jgi:hypothetical protein